MLPPQLKNDRKRKLDNLIKTKTKKRFAYKCAFNIVSSSTNFCFCIFFWIETVHSNALSSVIRVPSIIRPETFGCGGGLLLQLQYKRWCFGSDGSGVALAQKKERKLFNLRQICKKIILDFSVLSKIQNAHLEGSRQ